MKLNKTKKRMLYRLPSAVLAIIFALTLVLSVFPISTFADTSVSYIGVSSDIHGSVSNVSAWLAGNGSSLKYMVFGGDNADSWSSSNIASIKSIFSTSYPSVTPVFTMGNHDWSQGSAEAFSAATGNARTGIKNDPADEGYTIYTFGAASATYEFSTQNSDIADLTAALEAADKTEPFFIISHYPLNMGEGMDARTISNASTIITLLNKYPNVVFFWGHNHHSPDNTMNTIKAAGDSIIAADTNSSVKINFTYCNSGHMGSGNNLATTDGTGVRVKITDEGSTSEVCLSINEKDGTVLAEKTVDIGSSEPPSDIGSTPTAGNIYKQVGAITAGNKYIIAARYDGKYYAIAQATSAPSYNVQDVSVAVTDGADYGLSGTEIIADPGEDSLKWTASTASGGFYFTNGGYYLYAGKVDSSGASSSSGTVGLYAVTISRACVLSGTGLYSVGSSNYYYTYDGSSFGAVSGSSGAAAIYIFQEAAYAGSVTAVDSVALTDITAPASGSAPDISASITGGNATAGAVVWYPAVTDTFAGSTAYTATAVLTPALGYYFTASTSVTVNGSAATVKMLNGDGTLTVTYTFAQTAPAPTYIRADTIQDGETYVIVSNNAGKNGALNNSVPSTQTNYLTGTDVTVSEDAVTSSVTSDMLWTAEAGVSGMYFKSDGKYLTHGSSAKYLLSSSAKPGTTSGDWIYNSSNQLYVADGTNSYYLYRSTNNSNFRTDSAAQSGEKIYFYKRAMSAVTPVALESISAVFTQGGATVYPSTALDSLKAKLVVTGSYSDSSTLTIPDDDYSLSGSLAAPSSSVTVTCGGETTTFSVVVTPVALESISAVFTQGGATVYPSTALDSLKAKLVVTGSYSDSSTLTIPDDDYSLSGSLAAPSSSVTVTYGGETTTFNVVVTPVALESISVTKAPDKIAYVEGNAFDPSGMEVTAHYNDGATELLDAADYTYSPNGKLSATDKTITVTYDGKTAGTAISVSASSGTGGGYSTGGGISLPGIGAGVTIVVSSPVFSDVPRTSWYYGSVQYVVNAGIFKGTSSKVFEPDTPVSRAMFISILSRIEFGSDESIPTGSTSFKDLSQAWYKLAVAWGVRSGIIQGTSSVEFSPDEEITREQIAVLLYNYAKYKNYDMRYNAGQLDTFTDSSNISAYARTAMMWAVSKGLISGVTSNHLEPQSSATRAQAAVIIERFNELKA